MRWVWPWFLPGLSTDLTEKKASLKKEKKHRSIRNTFTRNIVKKLSYHVLIWENEYTVNSMSVDETASL